MEKPTTPKASRVQFVAGALVIIAIAVAAAAVGVAVLVFGAYGCGKLFARWLPFSPFEATVVSLLALVSTIGVAAKLLSRLFSSLRPGLGVERCAVCGGYHDVEDHEDAEEDDEEADLPPSHGLRVALYASGAVKPNAPCPCGSDRRYSKCCGDGRLFRRGRTGAEARAP